MVFNGTSTLDRSICANCGRVKPTQLDKDSRRDTMHNSQYVTQCNTVHNRTLRLQKWRTTPTKDYEDETPLTADVTPTNAGCSAVGRRRVSRQDIGPFDTVSRMCRVSRYLDGPRKHNVNRLSLRHGRFRTTDAEFELQFQTLIVGWCYSHLRWVVRVSC